MRRIGDFSQADFEALKLAEQMQALATSYIKDAFFAEEDLQLDTLTETKFIKALEQARNGGAVEQYEFNRMLGNMIVQAVQTVQQQSQQGGGRQQ